MSENRRGEMSWWLYVLSGVTAAAILFIAPAAYNLLFSKDPKRRSVYIVACSNFFFSLLALFSTVLCWELWGAFTRGIGIVVAVYYLAMGVVVLLRYQKKN